MVERKKAIKQPLLKSEPQNENCNLHQIDSQLGMLGVVLMLLCGTISSYLYTNLPNALTRANLESHPGAFIAERAWDNLKVLNDFGPKPTGSDANEILTANYLKREIEMIQASKHPNQVLLTDHQVVTGGYSVNYKSRALTSLYRNVQNLVVKLAGEIDNSTSPTLMLNCHFDTVASSPGASDDGASCCVMLEIMRVLSRSPKRNRHSIIFLFNGAEETPLQAAHGFITQHKWAKQVTAFLNLESAGSGGKEVLFQSGPQHPWMIDVYARSIRHPFAQTVAEEVFQFGLIPSDTDFRIFRDFGNIPGMDFAHVVEGYRYHTKYDNMDYLSLPVLQRTGDNILALTREMANSDELEKASLGKNKTGYSVFYDFMGLLFVCYSADSAITINTLVAILAIIVPYYGLSRTMKAIGEGAIVKQAIYGFLATVIGIVGSILTCFVIGRQLDAMGRALSWYSTPYLVLGLYCCPALLCHCFSQMIINWMFVDKKTVLNLSQIVQSRLIGVSLFWAMLVIGLTYAGIRTTYMFMVILLFSLMSSLVTTALNWQNTTRKWLLVHLAFQSLTMLWATQYYHMFMKLFIPLSGRSGGYKNPEFMIGSLAALSTLFISSYMVPLVSLLKRGSELTSKLTVFILLAVLMACFTQVGFPFRDDSAHYPTVQRHYVTHVMRSYYDDLGNSRGNDSGYLFREMDRHSYRLVRGIANPEKVTAMHEMNTCETEIFCAVPFYSMWHQIQFDNYWLPGPPPVADKVVTLKKIKHEQLNDSVRRLTFILKGSIQSSLIIGAKPGVKLVNWSLLDKLTPPTEFNNQKAHFVLITHGLPSDSWEITMDFEHDDKNHDGLLADIAVVTTHWEAHRLHTQQFTDLINKFPSWAHVVPSVAVMNIYVF
ncbi:endoplasmic reticulum metallopeptidase 1-like isoform X1 [Armigeres subalbatus]|uniref:endoplasmic reticulum metallopeptidase 1-like isoform X1 n=1 Tax=Armigeres subalbatus TaxID=124917 RepID=UPI002ED25750